MTKYFFTLLLGLTLLIGVSCNNSHKETKTTIKNTAPKKDLNIPAFNGDSAFHYVKTQCDFGPRVPGTEAHQACGEYLTNKLKQYADEVIVQETKVRAYDNSLLDCKNIIACFSPEKQNRVFLAAHWDSRHVADQDANPDNHKLPIIGANDGASGVGVLIEIARHLKKQQPEVGIDIILFDVEDYGTPSQMESTKQDTWALGSQYWAQNPHRFNYTAKYGILLDMVGAADAKFPHEAFSKEYASPILDKVWSTAHRLGYGEYFIDEDGTWINDDHYYINKLARIPTIDIIHLDEESINESFFDHWHTTKDNIDIIDPASLLVVGNTVMHVIFEE